MVKCIYSKHIHGETYTEIYIQKDTNNGIYIHMMALIYKKEIYVKAYIYRKNINMKDQTYGGIYTRRRDMYERTDIRDICTQEE